MKFPVRLMAAVMACSVLGAAVAPKAPERTDPILFFANLSPDEETTTTTSDAVGRADFSLDRATLRLSWNITFKNLSSAPISASIHGPQRVGVFGAVVYDLAPKGGIRSPLKGSVVMSEGELQYLLERHLYVNIHTSKWPEGELRGMLDRVPPPGSDSELLG